MVTCKRLDVESLRELLRLGAPVNGRSKDGSTALIGAAIKGWLEGVRTLARAGADLNAPNFHQQTALHQIAQTPWTGDDSGAAVIEELLALGAKPDLKDDRGRTPLIGACARGKLACVRALLAAGADPNAKNDDGDSPLITVMKETPKETVKIISELLRGGADSYQQDGLGFTPIGVAEIKSVSESDQGALAVFTAWQERQALEELSSPRAKGKSAGL